MHTSTQALTPVVLAGGSGTRLWPLSRESYPKQFLSLDGEASMLQKTIERLQGLPARQAVVISAEEHRFLVAEQLRHLGQLGQNIILEPARRNTAPALALAALHARTESEDPLLLVVAADHWIEDVEAFQAAVCKAMPLAIDGALVTFGITPSRPETGYGYIHQGAALDQGAYRVAAFVEKPSAEVATGFVAQGDYLWNSGMFLMRASRYLEELQKHRPDILASCTQAMAAAKTDLNFIRADLQAFTACADLSIDYAVMEKTEHAVVMPLNAGWSDIGEFAALWEQLPQDTQGNACQGDVVVHDSQNNLLIAESALVTTVGLKDTVVIQTKDAILVAPRSQAQQVKQIVATLKASGRSEHHSHRQVYRPWGHYDSVEAGSRYQVKRIHVRPGAKLSLQMHHHRAEHWIVVSGTARVSLDGKDRLLSENESIYLPLGAIHSLENPGKIPLELIEVQVGSYLGEDDIVRLQDQYGRC